MGRQTDRKQHHESCLKERQAVLIAVPGSVGQAWLSGRATAVSREGCRLVIESDLPSDMAIEIMFPGFAGRPAHLIRRAAGPTDCLFDTPLPDAIFDYLIRMSDSAARG